MSESISKRLIDAANKLVVFEAGHDPFYWDDKEVLEYGDLEAAFKSLALEVEAAVTYAENTAERGRRREQLWRELAEVSDGALNAFVGSACLDECIDERYFELRKQLGLED